MSESCFIDLAYPRTRAPRENTIDGVDKKLLHTQRDRSRVGALSGAPPVARRGNRRQTYLVLRVKFVILYSIVKKNLRGTLPLGVGVLTPGIFVVI